MVEAKTTITIVCDSCNGHLENSDEIYCVDCSSPDPEFNYTDQMDAIAKHLHERRYWGIETAEESLAFIADQCRAAGWAI